MHKSTKEEIPFRFPLYVPLCALLRLTRKIVGSVQVYLYTSQLVGS